MKKFVTILIIVITTFTLVGCGNKGVKKAIEEGKAAFEQRDYEKALTFFKTAIDKNTKDEEVKQLYTIIDTYLKSKALYEEGKYSEAKESLEDMTVDYTKYVIKEDLDGLKKNIQEKLKYIEDTGEYILSSEKYILDKNYEEGKNAIALLEERELTEEQKELLSDLKVKLNNLKNEIAEKDKKDEALEESNKGNNSNNSNNNDNKENSATEEEIITGPLDKEKAIKLVKKYLKDNGEYLPNFIVVDSENDKEFLIHCYDVIDEGNGKSHTATSGWYYVNKSNEEVTSMF